MYGSMKWRKDPDMKYTDMCIFIDQNVPKLAEDGKYPEVENTIYNYLWLLVKALAIKKRMFQNFQDYDGYAFYAAQRLYFALKKNYLNQGKVIKGKNIRPIKSCLNYTKALLYPMKIEYQREAFKEIISEDVVAKQFDAFSYREKLRDGAAETQEVSGKFYSYIKDLFKSSSSILDKVLEKSPFNRQTTEYKYLKISILLNCLYNLRVKKKLDFDPVTLILWKLPKSMASYTRVLLKEFCTALKVEIMDCHSLTVISDELLDSLISNPEGGTNKDYEEQY